MGGRLLVEHRAAGAGKSVSASARWLGSTTLVTPVMERTNVYADREHAALANERPCARLSEYG